MVNNVINSDSAKLLFNDIWEAYSSENRYYHNTEHLLEVFNEFEEAANTQGFSQQEIIKGTWALLYHDYYYDVSAQDNERESALKARKELNILGLSKDDTFHIYMIILATKHHYIGYDNLTCTVLDSDMSILGKSPKRYKQYAKDVYNEYKNFYTKEAYISGRKQFLESLLNKNRIYLTDYFHNKYNKSAIENIKNELESLTNG